MVPLVEGTLTSHFSEYLCHTSQIHWTIEGRFRTTGSDLFNTHLVLKFDKLLRKVRFVLRKLPVKVRAKALVQPTRFWPGRSWLAVEPAEPERPRLIGLPPPPPEI